MKKVMKDVNIVALDNINLNKIYVVDMGGSKYKLFKIPGYFTKTNEYVWVNLDDSTTFYGVYHSEKEACTEPLEKDYQIYELNTLQEFEEWLRF